MMNGIINTASNINNPKSKIYLPSEMTSRFLANFKQKKDLKNNLLTSKYRTNLQTERAGDNNPNTNNFKPMNISSVIEGTTLQAFMNNNKKLICNKTGKKKFKLN